MILSNPVMRISMRVFSVDEKTRCPRHGRRALVARKGHGAWRPDVPALDMTKDRQLAYFFYYVGRMRIVG